MTARGRRTRLVGGLALALAMGAPAPALAENGGDAVTAPFTIKR